MTEAQTLTSSKLFALTLHSARLSRLVVLNVSDNELKDLPLSLGRCLGLSKLGAGINLDRNPIESAGSSQFIDLLYSVTYQHLCLRVSVVQIW